MIADDNPDLRRYLTRLLSPYWEVEAVSNGADALRLARERAPDLLVTDVMMPELDGFELVAELRGAPEITGPSLKACAGGCRGNRSLPHQRSSTGPTDAGPSRIGASRTGCHPWSG